MSTEIVEIATCVAECQSCGWRDYLGPPEWDIATQCMSCGEQTTKPAPHVGRHAELRARIDAERRQSVEAHRADKVIDPHSITTDLLVALAALDDNQREAFVDLHMLGRTKRAVALDMGCSQATVRKHEKRAIEILQADQALQLAIAA